MQAVLPALGSVDIWKEYYDPIWDYGGEIKCEIPGGRPLNVFCYYLCSGSTYAVKVIKLDKINGKCVLQVFGPRCYKNGRLYIEQPFSKADIRLLSLAQTQQLKISLKRRVRKTDPEWGSPGSTEARELFRVLGLTY